MKIGVLTLRLYTNYGGLLQAYATQKLINNEGHEAITVYFVKLEKNPIEKFGLILKRFILKYLLGNSEIKKVIIKRPSRRQQRIVSKNTSKFLKKNINITKPLRSAREIKKIEGYEFDAFLVGSDQVWRPEYCPDIPTYFLNFTTGNDRIKKRIAFAASFGVSDWRFTEVQTNVCKNLIKQFDAVSVREDSAISLCKKYLECQADFILDPTLLLQKDDYLELMGDLQSTKESSLMAYVLDKSVEKTNLINKVATKLKLTPLTIMPKYSYDEISNNRLKDCIYPPVSEWLKGYYNADFVVTDSYHGTLFSILFNKPFIVVGNPKRGMARFKSILKVFNLENRLVENTNNFNDKLIGEKINFKRINEILEEKRNEGLNFLRNSLKN